MSNGQATVIVRAPRRTLREEHFTVSSETFSPDGMLPRETAFGECGGDNQSPQLTWHDAPADTKSFAVTCFDPDAPTGSGYWHWVAWNIAAGTSSIPLGAGSDGSPDGGTSGTNDYGFVGYGGPCPPAGDHAHRYVFTVYALDVASLDQLGAATTGASLVFTMAGHVLSTGTLTGRFSVG